MIFHRYLLQDDENRAARRMARATDPETSHAAASRVREGQLSQTQAKVLAALLKAGSRGLTDAELARLPQFAELRESTARKRRCELYQAGYLIPSGETRDHQTVWVAVRTAAAATATTTTANRLQP